MTRFPKAVRPPGPVPAMVGGLLCVALWLLPGVGAAAPGAKQVIREKGCGACHFIPGVPNAYGTTGPSLKGLKDRPRIAAGRLENTPENLRRWLSNPKAVRPDTLMPNLGLSAEEMDAVIAFLTSL